MIFPLPNYCHCFPSLLFEAIDEVCHWKASDCVLVIACEVCFYLLSHLTTAYLGSKSTPWQVACCDWSQDKLKFYSSYINSLPSKLNLFFLFTTCTVSIFFLWIKGHFLLVKTNKYLCSRVPVARSLSVFSGLQVHSGLIQDQTSWCILTNKRWQKDKLDS